MGDQGYPVEKFDNSIFTVSIRQSSEVPRFLSTNYLTSISENVAVNSSVILVRAELSNPVCLLLNV